MVNLHSTYVDRFTSGARVVDGTASSLSPSWRFAQSCPRSLSLMKQIDLTPPRRCHYMRLLARLTSEIYPASSTTSSGRPPPPTGSPASATK
jgi:hypothetical protein